MRAHWLMGLGLATGMAGAAAQSTTPSGVDPRADLALWHEAGMSFLPPVQEFAEVQASPEYRRYQQLRVERAAVELAAQQMEAQPTAATVPQPAVAAPQP